MSVVLHTSSNKKAAKRPVSKSVLFTFVVIGKYHSKFSVLTATTAAAIVQ